MNAHILALCCCLVTINALLVIPKNPPKPWQAALMARYIIHNTDWVAIATISSQDKIKGYPFVSLKSSSDGPKSQSTGITYLYMTSMDVSGKDVEADNRVTIMATLAETSYCESKSFDPQDPRCAKVISTGRLVTVNNDTKEYQFGKDALFSRHPSMKDWPTDHDFYVAKVIFEQIDVLDYFGGIKHVNITDYFNANITNLINQDVKFNSVSVVEIENY
ncbi:unnamed protein product [Callosobruchus maculatus]|uniref:CREG-like beta-barrel domain-containing protein n=1 Tax=Callosobruchus maculatus TaxID=64391 RepID=A0A653CKH9_CALMS|nr:unnamed protein product [Callosobruchus maculatus]